MFENILKFFKKAKKDNAVPTDSKSAAKERLHLVLMQDRANVSADFLDLMKQEIIDVIKKYIEVDENAMDVRLTNKENDDGTNGAPALYANIPILNIKNEARKVDTKKETKEIKKENKEDIKDNKNEDKSQNISKSKKQNKEMNENKEDKEEIEKEENKDKEEVKNEIEETKDVKKEITPENK